MILYDIALYLRRYVTCKYLLPLTAILMKSFKAQTHLIWIHLPLLHHVTD